MPGDGRQQNRSDCRLLEQPPLRPALLHYEELKARANHQMEGFLITTPAISGNNTMVVMGGAEYEVQALARLQAEA
jgi:hypothetical protein